MTLLPRPSVRTQRRLTRGMQPILAGIVSYGVVWELFEFGLDIVADTTGLSMPLAQHGLDDTVREMVVNTFGAIVVATFGQAHLLDVAESITERLSTAN